MGEVMRKWEQSRQDFPRFLGSVLDDEEVMDSGLFCHYLTLKIKEYIHSWKTGNGYRERLKPGDDVWAWDGETHHHGEVVSLINHLDVERKRGYYPLVLLDGEELPLLVINKIWLENRAFMDIMIAARKPPTVVDGRSID